MELILEYYYLSSFFIFSIDLIVNKLGCKYKFKENKLQMISSSEFCSFFPDIISKRVSTTRSRNRTIYSSAFISVF